VLLAGCGDDSGSADSTLTSVTTAATTTALGGPTVFVRGQTSIAVPLGSSFILELASNATTGYAWEPQGGTMMLTFEYRRSFEPATTPAIDIATFTITVTG